MISCRGAGPLRIATALTWIFALGAGLSHQVQGVDATRRVDATRTGVQALIVAGGADAQSIEYAIESNARFLVRLLDGASVRVLFADGKKESNTVTVTAPIDFERERVVLNAIVEPNIDVEGWQQRASSLERIDGAATRGGILRELNALSGRVQPGQSALLYFSGHGSQGPGAHSGTDRYDTTYVAWRGALSALDLSRALDRWPSSVPLTLVMAQCYSGGFARALWQGGDPAKGVATREFAGFFASTCDRQSAGCTPEVNEHEYQDFTTHFFAALSGQKRQGGSQGGADFDGDGGVSGLEAFVHANLHDDSIDVPTATSEAFLRHALDEETENSLDRAWTKAPYSRVLDGSNPWQKSLMDGLSRQLGIDGEDRLQNALAQWSRLSAELDDEEGRALMAAVPGAATLEARLDRLRGELVKRFPALAHTEATPAFERAERAALTFLAAPDQRAQRDELYGLIEALRVEIDKRERREALLWRFVRAAHTLELQRQLHSEASPSQRAVFARLRANEARNPLFP